MIIGHLVKLDIVHFVLPFALICHTSERLPAELAVLNSSYSVPKSTRQILRILSVVGTLPPTPMLPPARDVCLFPRLDRRPSDMPVNFAMARFPSDRTHSSMLAPKMRRMATNPHLCICTDKNSWRSDTPPESQCVKRYEGDDPSLKYR